MYGNNAYNKDTFSDILVVQGSIITVTKLANNKSLLSQFYILLVKPNNAYCTQKIEAFDYHSALQRSYTGSCILASLARNVKAVKTFYPGCIGTPKADIAIAYCTLNNCRPAANK